tara:strand:+ start:775 stop:909 length:135 start_codon:yes stop_codon:yes gene_type:complete
MANYKKKTAKVNIPFTYKGTHYKKGAEFKDKQIIIDALIKYLKQ